jgi:hypothetical protein
LFNLGEFVSFFQYCKSLQFEEKPDYSYLKSLLKTVFERYNYVYDYLYDWDATSSEKKQEDIYEDEPLPEIADENKNEFKLGRIEKICFVNRLYKKS